MALVPALEVSGLSKTFPGQRAVIDLDLSLAPGEVRALVGQNGCGKSTLVKVLAGFHAPDPGCEVRISGEPMHLGFLGAGESAGLRFVHQDLGLVETLNSVDNLALGHGYTISNRRIRWRREAAAATTALAGLGYQVDVRQPVSGLTVSERTAVAIARALSPRHSKAAVLVLDEPTSSLPGAEVERLFRLIRTVAATGVAVLFVSHHLTEVFELADSVTVMRDGREVTTRPTAGLDEPGLIELMIGRRQSDAVAAAGTQAGREDAALTARSISGKVVRDLDLDLHPGEVLGVAGITGSGREEVAAMLFGAAGRRGRVEIGGSSLPQLRPDLAVAAGIGLVPAERHRNAAFLEATIRENITVVRAGSMMVHGILRKSREKADVAVWLDRLQVRPPRSELALEKLSGGNQQKVVLARWLRQRPSVLLLDEPTQGVDVGAKADIHALIDKAADEGAAVLVASTDNHELARLCSRVLILKNGRADAELRRPQIDGDRITAMSLDSSTSD
jgi:ribose transport system ATP-binding protein